MKGIILAAGKGTRLYPATKAISKPMLPVYDRPMIYYPMAVLMSLGIREIQIISSPADIGGYNRLFGDGSSLGLDVSYAVQNKLRGIADAFTIAKGFIGDDDVCLMLGDNIFLGQAFYDSLQEYTAPVDGAVIFGYPVEDPRSFGVVEFDENFNVLSLEEKPEHPKSNYIVPGLYFYDSSVTEVADQIEPSARGELEITDVNKVYLQKQKLKVKLIDKETEWFDAGSADGLLTASNAAARAEKESGEMNCIEEIAYKKGFIDAAQLNELLQPLKKTKYGKHIEKVLSGEI
ncbi:MAG: glucose-1-phosphate thymidylyltransferase RfbA [Anaerovoracaceae bacterium]|nr:glucose-1-phosphate thymidylyltransferase RfbA [Bacillota bacterium]MDY2670401.1 glucose-1-phosphate thymidylyltransferase RfbA [Anaerovoracaceae bacterium]